MSIDLKLLIWSVALAFLQMLVAVIGAQMQVGLPPLVGNREKLPDIWGGPGAPSAHMATYLKAL